MAELAISMIPALSVIFRSQFFCKDLINIANAFGTFAALVDFSDRCGGLSRPWGVFREIAA